MCSCSLFFPSLRLIFTLKAASIHFFTNINQKGLQRTANEYAGKRRIYKDLISKNDILNSASRILQC